jgi:polyhydroxyalkanoate synthesis repressor PhaR
MLNKPEASGEKREVVVIKKYANRRLYNTETSTYVTLDDLAAMVRSDRDFVVYDAKTGDELTHSVLTQIIVDQEGKGQTLLPIPFLRQLIRFYDDSIARMVPTYLQFSLETLAKEQERLRGQFSSAFGNPAAAFDAYQEQARRNMAIFEQAMSLWTPFTPQTVTNPEDTRTKSTGTETPAGTGSTGGGASLDDLAELRTQLAAMQQMIEKLSRDKE